MRIGQQSNTIAYKTNFGCKECTNKTGQNKINFGNKYNTFIKDLINAEVKDQSSKDAVTSRFPRYFMDTEEKSGRKPLKIDKIINIINETVDDIADKLFQEETRMSYNIKIEKVYNYITKDKDGKNLFDNMINKINNL